MYSCIFPRFDILETQKRAQIQIIQCKLERNLWKATERQANESNKIKQKTQ